MLEPVAAIIFNTVLSGRSHLERYTPLQSVVRIVKATTPRPITSNFFIAQPRRVKGKGRSTGLVADELDVTTLSSRCREWSVQTRNSLYSSRRNQSIITTEACPSKLRSSRRTSLSRTSTFVPRSSPSFRTQRAPGRAVHAAQRRHASRMSDPPASDGPTPITSSSNSSSSSSASSPNHAFDDPPAIPTTEQSVSEFLSMLTLRHDFDPDAAWSAYLTLVETDVVSQISPRDLLIFTDKICVYCETHHYSKTVELSRLHTWGERVNTVLSAVHSRVAPLSKYDHWLKCGIARGTAIQGDIDGALLHIHRAKKIPVEYEQDGRTLRAWRTLVYFTYRYYDASRVLTLVAKEWLDVGSHMTKASSHFHFGIQARSGASLRKATHRIVAGILRPVPLLANNPNRWSPDILKRAGELLIDAYLSEDLALLALETLKQLRKQGVDIAADIQLNVVRGLVREDTLGLAKELFHSIHRGTVFRHYLQTALHLYANAGDNLRAESYYNELTEHGWVNERDVNMLIHSYGTQGQSERVRTLFDRFFPLLPDGKRDNNPGIHAFAVAMYSCARSGEIEGLDYWLGEMVKAGLKPDIVIYNTILQGFARSGATSSINMILEQMRLSDTPPTIVTYVQLMALLAHRNDAAGVESLYRRAIEQGIVPNRRLVNTLMDAHVQAGSWKGVIRVFDYMQSETHPRIRLTIDIYNTLIKAYVRIGAPFPVVSKIFSKLEDLNVKPDSYSFALLIQSACDAGQMSVASDIYHEMDKLASFGESDLHIDVYILTIIMAGYLRANKRKQAKAVYDEMVRREIQPDAVTFNVLLTSYGNMGTANAIRTSEAFLNDLMNTPDRPWMTPTYGKPSALELVYGPVLRGYAAVRSAEDVERIYEEYITAGGSDTIGTLTARLDAYRRTLDIDAVKEIWPAIFELGLAFVQDRPTLDVAEDDQSLSRLMNNVLCVPLSLYIDALSAAGEHEEIAKVWRVFQENGFFFDAHNWNHLAVALIRAGQVARAFQVVENVIFPYRDQAQQMISARDQKPSSPVVFVSEAGVTEEEAENDRVARDSQAQLRTTSQRRHGNIVQNTRRALFDLEEAEAQHPDDLAYPMHILHQISPAWNVWDVHRAVTVVFLEAMENLRSGIIPRPLRSHSDRQTFENYEVPSLEEQREAYDLLEGLRNQYPRTTELVSRYEQRERRRLGVRYDRKYASGS